MAARKGAVLAKVTVADDLEVHVKTEKIEGETLVEVRDFIPSRKEYGRGAVLPSQKDVLTTVGQALIAAGKDA